ncbi:MAG: flotillin family protein [Crocosphaera sp.]
MEFLAFLLGLFGLGSGASLLIIRNHYHICQPSEVLIFAGSNPNPSNSLKGGYRLVKGGSSLRVPLLEEVFKMDLTNMIIDLKVSNAYAKGGVPLTVEGVANIKIAGEEPLIHNAIERLLGKKRQEIEQLAKETLEGNLRGVLANLTPEQANADQIAFAKSLLEEAETDLEKLGLALDSLQIQTISDNVNYLDSIGRKQQAELIRDARVAEAKAKSESIIQDSANIKATALRRIERDLEIAKADSEKRVRDAQTKRTAMISEAESIVMSELAKVEAEVAVETERIKQVEQQLQADIIAPAEAECQRKIAEAQGQAAKIIEDGKAEAEGKKQLALSWKMAGKDAKQIFLFQKIEPLMELITEGVPEIDIETVTLVQETQGNMVPKMVSFIEQLKQTTGIDASKIQDYFNSNSLIESEDLSNIKQSS